MKAVLVAGWPTCVAVGYRWGVGVMADMCVGIDGWWLACVCSGGCRIERIVCQWLVARAICRRGRYRWCAARSRRNICERDGNISFRALASLVSSLNFCRRRLLLSFIDQI